MSKKLLTSLLTATIVMVSSVVAFAAPTSVGELGGDPSNIEHEGEVKKPTISVEIESAATKIVANPYGLAIEGAEIKDDQGATIGYETLVGDTITVTNKSNMQIAVGITGKVDAASTIKLATDPKTMAADTKNKNLYVQGVITDNAGNAMLVKKGGKEIAPVVFTAKGAAFTDPVLAAGTGTAAAAEGGVVKVVISGATSFPATDAWNDDDTFSVTTTFDIKASTADTSVFATGS